MSDLVGVPIGGIIAWPGNRASIEAITSGGTFRLCNGDGLPIPQHPEDDYAALYAVLGDLWKRSSNGQFYLPNLLGCFLRGVDLQRGVDPDVQMRIPQGTGAVNDVATFQSDQLQDHSHSTDLNASQDWPGTGDGGSHAVTYEFPPDRQTHYQTGSPGNGNHGLETRPKNMSVHWIIRVK